MSLLAALCQLVIGWAGEVDYVSELGMEIILGDWRESLESERQPAIEEEYLGKRQNDGKQ
jgi:hypothetical protein